MKRSEAPVKAAIAPSAREVDLGALPDETTVTPKPSVLGVAQIAPGAVRVPHDPINEHILIGAACALEPEKRRELLRSLPSESFFGKQHAEFWSTLIVLDDRGLDFSLDTVVQLSGGKLDAGYFATVIAARQKPPPNLLHHVDMLRWDALRIEAAQTFLVDVIDRFRDQATEPAVLAATARALADALSGGVSASGTHDPNALIASNRASYEARKLAQPIWPYEVVPGGAFERAGKLDGPWEVKPGMKPGKVTVLTALSGHGKSIFAKATALGQHRLKNRGLFGAFEDESEEVLEDLAAMALGFDRNAVDEARLLPDDEARLFAAQEEIAATVRFMRRPPNDGRKGRATTAGKIEWCFSEATRIGASWIAFDLFARLIETLKPEEEQKAWERLQDCAKSTKVHALATHQQRVSDIEGRSDKRPTRDGLKGSKGVLEVADTMIGLFRPALVQSVEDKSLEAIVLKQRRGRFPFAIRFDFDPKTWGLSNPREVSYLRPGEDALDDMVQRPQHRGRSSS